MADAKVDGSDRRRADPRGGSGRGAAGGVLRADTRSAGIACDDDDLRWIGLLLVASALAVGAFARLVRLDAAGLWLDEGWSLWFATRAGLDDLLRENHPPLYYLILRAATHWVDSDAALRATGSIAAAGTVFATWRIARGAWPRSIFAACIATALVAVASVNVEAARELRMYAWTPLAFAFALLAALRAADGSRLALAGFAAASVALFYLHGVGGIFVAGAFAFGLVVAPDRRTRLALLASVTLAGLVYAPWFAASTLQRVAMMDDGLAWNSPPSIGGILQTPARLFVDADPPWAEPEGLADPCALARAETLCRAAGFTTAFARSRTVLVWVLAMAAIAVALASRGARSPRERIVVGGLAAAFLVPWLLLAAAARVALPFWDVRYLAPCSVPAALAFAGWCEAAPRSAAVAVQSALVAIVATMAIALPQQGPWAQWREASRRLTEARGPEDLVLLNMIGQGGPLLVARYAADPTLAARTIALRDYVDDQYGPRRCTAPDRACLDAIVLPSDAPAQAWMLRAAPLDVPRYRFREPLQAWIALHFAVDGIERFRGIELYRLLRIDGPVTPDAPQVERVSPPSAVAGTAGSSRH